MVTIVITAVITFGRSSSGARVVRIAISGAVATAPSPAANITAITPIAGSRDPEQEQRRRDPEDPHRREADRRHPFASGIAESAPITDPAPNAPNINPAVRALAS